MDDGVLLYASVAGIQEWIVGNTTELRVVRGGSRLLEETFQSVVNDLKSLLGDYGTPAEPGIRRWQLIAQSSGQMSLLLDPDEDIESIATQVRGRLARELPGLTVTVGTASLAGPTEPGETPFTAAKRRAMNEAVSTGTRVPAGYHLGTQVCDATGVATATCRTTDRWQAKSATPEGWRLSPDAWHRYDQDVGDIEHENVQVARDLASIGAATLSSRYAGYVGVISADGNAIGARFLGLSTAELVERESGRVADAIETMEQAAYSAALEHHAEQDGDLPLPVNPVVRAGDDLRFVVPGHVALPFAAALTDASSDLKACAGVLLCHANLPFNVAHDASEELLSRAKQASKSHPDADAPPYVGFAVEAGTGVRDELGDDRVSASPYASRELKKLLQAARLLEVSPTSVRNALGALERGGRIADREWALWYLAAPPQAQQQLKELWELFGAPGDPADTPFPVRRWRDGHGAPGERLVSPLGDLLILHSLETSPAAELGVA